MLCCYAESHYAECYNAECHYAKCHNAECRYAECRVAIFTAVIYKWPEKTRVFFWQAFLA
jgi:hypothetical protein